MKILSYCLWGNNEVYNYGLLENIFLSNIYYPSYKIYVYHSKNCIPDVLSKMKEIDKVVLFEVDMSENSAINMMYRFTPAFTAKEDDIVLVRDTDSIINKKEMLAVIDFEKSDKQFHIMRDHPAHKSLIMGGMWGCKGNILNSLEYKFNEYISENRNTNIDKRCVDQIFLNTYVYPLVINNSLIHASHNKFEDFSIDFPSTNIDNCDFIGQIINNFPITNMLLNLDINKKYKRIVDYKF